MRLIPIALFVVLVINVALFATPLYRNLLAPDSSAGSFERAVRRVDRTASAASESRDILVLGDSRIFNGFDASAARAAAPALRFVNAAVPGTTPRVWSVLDRVVDPQARRFRAVVIPVDTLADDDSAIGSIDGDDRAFDLKYVALRTNFAEIGSIAASFPAEHRLDSAFALALRGPLIREDLHAFARDPVGRIAALRHGSAVDEPYARTETLAGLRIDFATQTLSGRTLAPDLAGALRRQLFAPVRPSPPYARYRREWLGTIVRRYVKTGVPVVFVRIPTRPAHAGPPSPASGMLAGFAHEPGVTILPQEPYVALERPELFADADHLDAAGRARFSTRLGGDVARFLRSRITASRIAATDALVLDPTHEVDGRAHHRFAFVAKIAIALGIGVPLRFQSIDFAVFFLVVVTIVRVARVRRVRTIVLLVASWYFYARWNAWYLVVLIGLTGTDYVFARLVDASDGARRRLFLGLGIAANLAFLGTAKYADFVTATLAHVLGRSSDPWLLHVLVPIGISFHTFQSISYLVDVGRRKFSAVRDPFDYVLYIAFFPQLLAGPIVRAATFFPELWSGGGARRDAIVRGILEIALGLLKKSALADRFAPVADAYFANVPAHPGAAAAWSAALAFAIEIYFDFSGYSDIAIGCARILGFDFPQNFRRPYLAWSVTEFWRRWHMTLSAWLRDYLYIPLGGNRYGSLATYRNLMLTMLLGGLWHGANWTFVAWGGYHGALLALERGLGIGRTGSGDAPRGVDRIARTATTFVLVLVGWVLFRAQDFGVAREAVRALFVGVPGPALLDLGQLAIVAVAFTLELVAETRPLRLRELEFPTQVTAVTVLLLALEFATYPGAAAPFVYFKF